MKKLFLLALFILLPASTAFSQEPQIGDQAPNLNIYKWLNGTPLDSNISGKVIVLEFWATWCGPCKKIIPHMNDLVKEFASDSVVFISMSKEMPDKVVQFMKKTEMDAYVVIDYNGQTSKDYAVKGIPHAFIINPFGKIVWKGHPAMLKAEDFRDYLTRLFQGDDATEDN